MTALSINNVINISVAAMSRGLNSYNTSNLAVVTNEPVLDAITTLNFDAIAASGTFQLQFPGGSVTPQIAWDHTDDQIQSRINTIPGLGNVIVTGSIVSQTLTLTQPGNFGPIPLPTAVEVSLQTAGSVEINITSTQTSAGWSGGNLGYALYNSPQQVGLDFGTNSKTYMMANAVFSQQPNILNGNGQFIALLAQVTQQTLRFSLSPDSGAFNVGYNSIFTNINFDDTPAQIQAKLRVLTGLSEVQVTGAISNQLLTIIFKGVYGNAALLSISGNTLENGSTPVDITGAQTVAGETYGQTIFRTQGLVQYFGVMPIEPLAIIGQIDMLAASAIILPLNLINFFVSYTQADIQPGGKIDLLRSGSYYNSRGLYYGDSSNNGINALLMMAAYAGQALSVNFSGSNTTSSMNLKTLLGIQPDPTMNETIDNLAKASGADIYVSYQGIPSVVSNGANKFFDMQYNLEWFVGALQVSAFNYLKQTATKVPQTENGMTGLKNSYDVVCQQAVTNQYIAPGSWTSSTTFGNQQLFLQNILQFGYYIYSTPISQQLAADRQARIAPLVQIAIKEAGAIQKSNVTVYVNQ